MQILHTICIPITVTNHPQYHAVRNCMSDLEIKYLHLTCVLAKGEGTANTTLQCVGYVWPYILSSKCTTALKRLLCNLPMSRAGQFDSVSTLNRAVLNKNSQVKSDYLGPVWQLLIPCLHCINFSLLIRINQHCQMLLEYSYVASHTTTSQCTYIDRL